MKRALAGLALASVLACASSDDNEPPKAAVSQAPPPPPVVEAEATPDTETDAPAAELGPEVDPTPRAVFATEVGEITVALEIADTRDERIRGTTHRESMTADTGMIYVFDTEGRHPFWMKDTYVALDIIHLDSSGKVVGIIADAEPLTVERRRIAVPSRFVIEVLGGYAASKGIVEGSQVTLMNVESGPPQ
ncbi:MAG: DUF192 domain-containing protein [Myxococcota bacterium]